MKTGLCREKRQKRPTRRFFDHIYWPPSLVPPSFGFALRVFKNSPNPFSLPISPLPLSVSNLSSHQSPLAIHNANPELKDLCSASHTRGNRFLLCLCLSGSESVPSSPERNFCNSFASVSILSGVLADGFEFNSLELRSIARVEAEEEEKRRVRRRSGSIDGEEDQMEIVGGANHVFLEARRSAPPRPAILRRLLVGIVVHRLLAESRRPRNRRQNPRHRRPRPVQVEPSHPR